jgi:hypothetical protein
MTLDAGRARPPADGQLPACVWAQHTCRPLLQQLVLQRADQGGAAELERPNISECVPKPHFGRHPRALDQRHNTLGGREEGNKAGGGACRRVPLQKTGRPLALAGWGCVCETEDADASEGAWFWRFGGQDVTARRRRVPPSGRGIREAREAMSRL